MGVDDVKKNLILLIFIMAAVLAYGAVEIDGIKYYEKSEVVKLGMEPGKNGIIKGDNEIEILGDQVVYRDYSVQFPHALKEKNGKTYYNSYLVDGIAKVERTEDPTENIVSLSPGITEKIFALGLGENLVGRTMYCTYPQEVEEIPQVGSMLEPSFEKVIVRNPQIILMEAHYNEGFVNQLKRVGMEYRIYETPKNLREMYEHITDLGELLGVEMRAGILRASLETISEEYRLKGNKQGIKPSIYYALGTGRAEYTAGGDTFIGDILEYAGGKNIAADKKGWTYSLEELISKNPEYIVGSSGSLETLKKEKKYSLLRAVREGKLIEVDTDIYNLPGVRAVKIGIPLIYDSIH